LTGTAGTNVDSEDVARFESNAPLWWDELGPFAPLHRLNPVRIGYVRDRLCAHFGRDARRFDSLEQLSVLDIGCGGGLSCEPMARLGADVTGADAGPENIAAARAHAETMSLDIAYVEATAEAMAARGKRFDAVVCMEVIEHVPDAGAFLAACGSLVNPGGAMVMATLNRTLKGYALGVVAAEYVLGWLPRGTHDWNKFVRPSELAAALRGAGLTLADLSGVVFDPIRAEWRLGRDISVNYMAFAIKEH